MGLVVDKPARRRHWNRIPEPVRELVVERALGTPELSCRELACRITDTEKYFLSESSVYRILKKHDLIVSPAYELMRAADKFQQPTRQINELWQTDFTYFRVVGWGWYYLSTVLDDYSRYILSWQLTTTMRAEDVTETLDVARAAAGVDHVRVRHQPRLLSDNGPCYVSGQLRDYLGGAPDGAYARGSVSPDDPGKDRALPPLDEECREARELLLALGARARNRAVRRVLQPPPLP